MIGSAPASERYESGRIYQVRIRPTAEEPYIETSIYIRREATYEEFVTYNRENYPFTPDPHFPCDCCKFYEILMD